MNKEDVIRRISRSNMAYAVVSIDGQQDIFCRLHFLAAVSTAGARSTYCVGSYKGTAENSYLLTCNDLIKVIELAGDAFFERQESFLLVSECSKAYAHLMFLDGRPDEPLGSMCNVTREEAIAVGDYTYRPDINAYWICKHKNPDTLPPPMGWPTAEQRKTLGGRIAHVRYAASILAADKVSSRRDMLDSLEETARWIEQQYLEPQT